MNNDDNERNPDIIIVGHIAYDTIVLPRQSPFTRFGGAAWNAACGALCVSSSVGLISKVGEDMPLSTLHSKGVDTRGIRTTDGKSPHFYLNYDEYLAAYHMTDEFNTVRRFAADEVSIPPGYYDAYSFHIATMPPDSQISFAAHIREKAPRSFITLDTAVDFIKYNPQAVCRVADYVDLVYLNRNEFPMLIQQCSTLKKKMVVYKKDESGAILLQPGRSSVSKNAPSTVTIDPTGAGDVFAGVFTSHYGLWGDEDSALATAVHIASCSTSYHDPAHMIEKIYEYNMRDDYKYE